MVGADTKKTSKNALAILAYYDIFKNYYANTQEENFYIIGNSENLSVAINKTEVNPDIIPSHDTRRRNNNHKSKHNKTKRNTNQSSKKFTNRTK